MLTKIRIQGLFDKFNYEIELKEEGITILTGPNGYGKTTILKILHALTHKNLIFFFNLPFKEIEIIKSENQVKLSKADDDNLEIQWMGKTVDYTKHDFIQKFKHLTNMMPIQQIEEDRWLDRNIDTIYTTENLLIHLAENNPSILAKLYKKELPDFIDAYLIREQRLIRKSIINRKSKYPPYPFDENFNETIKIYANELSVYIKDVLAKASQIGQELDSSFPKRLFDEPESISEADFNKRYDIIKEKQKALHLYGLSATQEGNYASFKLENAKALLVYLNDTEKKLAGFDDLLEKLKIFATILNKREFVFKQLKISPDFGFKFLTDNDKELPLTELSSGEQQEVVLLYELLFKIRQNTIVLIDEPEISLHVAWQKEVLNDLLKISKLRKIEIIVATHSPQIIDDKWDWVVDLEEISR